MHIDITKEPPVDIFRDRGKYLKVAIALLGLVVCGILLAVYVMFSDTLHSETLETIALALFVGPGLVFVYFAEKLKAYKRLSPDQKKKLTDLGRKYPEISTYCTLVARGGRELILAEYEACEDRVEELSRKTPADTKK